MNSDISLNYEAARLSYYGEINSCNLGENGYLVITTPIGSIEYLLELEDGELHPIVTNYYELYDEHIMQDLTAVYGNDEVVLI